MLGDLQELLRPCFREKFRECCCQLTSRGYLWPCAIAFLKVMLSKVIERHLGSPVLHSASGLPTVTKSHDALTSGPPAHRFAPLPAGVTGITAQLVQSLGTLLERSHYSCLESKCFRLFFLGALGTDLPCSNVILYWPDNSSHLRIFHFISA